jgi:small subunit ribosomal protein S6
VRHYEIVLIINPDHSERIKSMIGIYSSTIIDASGIIHRVEEWGRRQLAYPIQNLNKAYYILLNIEASKSTINTLENSFRLNEAVIRSAIIRVKKPINTLSPMAKLKSDVSSDEKPRNQFEK